jgi:hypothetical protein
MRVLWGGGFVEMERLEESKRTTRRSADGKTIIEWMHGYG